MEEQRDQDVEAFERANGAMREFTAANTQVLNEFRRLSGHFNDAVKVLQDRAKSLVRERGLAAQVGPCSAKPVWTTLVDFDALEETVTDEEFRSVVAIEYKFRGEKGAEGKAALDQLRGKYGPKLAGLETKKVKQVSTTGPRELDLRELEVML